MKKILLSTYLEERNIPVDKPCGGNGTCGKCKIIVHGQVSALSQKEKEVLTEEEIAAGVRLACQTTVHGDIQLDYSTKKDRIQGMTDGAMPTVAYEPIMREKDGYGLAVDIGTTTIAGYLYQADECIKKMCLQNPQSEFGADVISRIAYANEGGLQVLQQAVVKQIKTMAEGVSVDTVVITGNTAMLHILCGLDPGGIAVAPFTTKTLFNCWKDHVYFPPCISAYIGADIVTAILASDMMADAASLLIDIGTNGEMALWHEGKFVCCSTATGPALEGAGISQGCLAVRGAVNHVWLEENKVNYTTIEGGAPIGICGTGIIDAVAVMLQLMVVDETGFLEKPFVIGDSGIAITAQDIRQVQLAKAAVRAGIDTLLEACGISYETIEQVYIAGGFGSYLNKYSCGAIGMIPAALLEKVNIIGNGAGMGASMILQSKQCLEKCSEIAAYATTVELSSNSVFMEKYIDNMMF